MDPLDYEKYLLFLAQKNNNEKTRENNFLRVKDTCKANEYLQDIYEQYINDYNESLREKQHQKKALHILLNYLEHPNEQHSPIMEYIQEDIQERKKIKIQLKEIQRNIKHIKKLIKKN
jgi:hypothetical protein